MGIFSGFLLAFVLLVLLATGQRTAIEADLAARAHGVLDLTGETWADVRFVGRDALVTGEALAEQARVKVRAAVAEVFGVRSVADGTTLLPERRPFTFSAVKDGKVLQLTGYLPSAAARARVLEAARRMPGVETVQGGDQLVRARGAPAGDFADVVEFGLAQLAQLASGRVTLSDDAMAIEGRSPDFPTFDTLSNVFRGDLPQGFHLARFSVRPPVVAPFVWSALREGGEVRMVGYVPEPQAAFAAISALRAALPGTRIADLTRVADGAPPTDRWLGAVAYAAGLLSNLPSGRVTLSNTAISVEGAAPSFEAFDALMAARRAVPEGFSLTRFAVEPPRVSPYVWSASRTLNGMRIAGYVPAEDVRRAIMDGARGMISGGPVVDEMRLATGAPALDTFVAAVTFSLSQLAKMRTGTATLSGARLTLVGEAPDAAALAALREVAVAAPPGLVVDVDIHPPLISPFVFAVRRDTEGVTVSGFYPDAQVHDVLLGQLADAFPGAKVTDVSALGGGAPNGFAAAAGAGVAQMARFENAELRIENTAVHLTGTTRNAAAAGEVEHALAAGLPSGFSGDVEAQVAEASVSLSAEACRTGAAALGVGLGFSGRAVDTDPAGTRVFDDVVALARACPDLGIFIRPAGDPLARARGALLVQRFGRAGIAAERVGLGPGSPGQEGAVALHLTHP